MLFYVNLTFCENQKTFNINRYSPCFNEFISFEFDRLNNKHRIQNHRKYLPSKRNWKGSQIHTKLIQNLLLKQINLVTYSKWIRYEKLLQIEVSKLFANDPGDQGSIPVRVIPKTQKMVHDAALLDTQLYKVRIKGKVKQSSERSSVLTYT